MSNLKVCPCSVALFDSFIYDTVRGLSPQAELSQVQFRLNDWSSHNKGNLSSNKGALAPFEIALCLTVFFYLQVINILIAIKEGGPSFLAPTLEKAIDILKNSEIFLPQFQSIKSDDPITSELVNNLINVSVRVDSN